MFSVSLLLRFHLFFLTQTTRTISIPFPSHRLASFALRTLQVDTELSPLVRRSFSLQTPDAVDINATTDRSHVGNGNGSGEEPDTHEQDGDDEAKSILRTVYEAATNRMLRVAVNGFMESITLVIAVMEELDVDVLGDQP